MQLCPFSDKRRKSWLLTLPLPAPTRSLSFSFFISSLSFSYSFHWESKTRSVIFRLVCPCYLLCSFQHPGELVVPCVTFLSPSLTHSLKIRPFGQDPGTGCHFVVYIQSSHSDLHAGLHLFMCTELWKRNTRVSRDMRRETTEMYKDHCLLMWSGCYSVCPVPWPYTPPLCLLCLCVKQIEPF